MFKFYSFIFMLVLSTSTAFSQLVINEYSASNESIAGAVDVFGNNEDYFEIYNAGASPLNLLGYYFSDRGTNPTKWQITTAVTINPNARMMVYCSGEDTIVNMGAGVYQFHPDFKLTQCHGEQIVIADAGGNIIDSLTMIRTQRNQSRGRTTDGAATWGLFQTPNPNASNSGAVTDYLVRPSMSVAPGFYNAAQSVSLSTTSPNSEIRYTLNGSVPTATSTLYTGPINVASTTVIRARTFPVANPSYAPSFTETNTYFINVNHTFPVVSVCGNYTTVLFPTAADIRTSIEYFDASKNFKWEGEGTSNKHGNDSWAYPQKGFDLLVHDEYGYIAEMPEKFFETSNRDSFKNIIFKAGASDNYPSGGGNWSTGVQKPAHMRDALCQTFSIKYGFELDERSYNPCIVYINGQYWGVYEIRERVDEHYTKYYYDQPEKKIDMIRHWGGASNIIDAGSDSSWTNLRNFINSSNMTLQSSFDHVNARLNLNSLIDFFVLNNYIVNTDHMNWNTMWWRGRKGAGVKWRYALWDQDNILDLGQNFTGLSTTGPSGDPCEPFSVFTNSNIIFHTQIINGLLQNDSFRHMYKRRYANWLNTCLTCDTLLKHVDYFEALLTPEMNAHVVKWGGSFNDWQNNVDSIRDFIQKRCTLVAGSNDTCMDVQNIKFNVVPAGTGSISFNNNVIPNYPYKQITNTNEVHSITAIPQPGYRLKTWQKFNISNVISPTLQSPIAFLDYKEQDSIVAIFEVIPPDTFDVVIDANPRYAGSIVVDGSTTLTLPNFPYSTKMIEKTDHTLKAAPLSINHKFVGWTQANSANNVVTPSLSSDSISINIKKGDTLVALFDTIIYITYTVTVPNAFSPNGDGKNDFFKISPVRPEYVSSAKLQIFNRYGELVFDGDALKGWNGIYKDDDCEPGVYIYNIKIVYTDKVEKVLSGDLMLVK